MDRTIKPWDQTPSTYIYKLAFTQYEFALASASAFFIFLLSMCGTYFYIRHQKAR